MPFIFILFAIVILISSFTSMFSAIANGGVTSYDYDTLQDYAYEQYFVEFDESAEGFEDNILIVMLVEDEEFYDYYYFSMAGNHVNDATADLFGGDTTLLGRTIRMSLNSQSYKYSLSNDLKRVVSTMKSSVQPDPFTCDESHTADSHITNKSDITIDAALVNEALDDFTAETGVPIVVVVEDMDDVFVKSFPSGLIFQIIITLGVIALLVFVVIRKIKESREGGGYDDDKYNNY